MSEPLVMPPSLGRRLRVVRVTHVTDFLGTGVASWLVPYGLKDIKRILLGRPIASHHLEGQGLRKAIALPVFASDALSSVAYAPQELLMILTLGGLSFLSFAPWVAAAIIGLLLVVVASYRQLVKAYPSGGGDYEVAHRNIGAWAGMIVAASLLVDYILTVAVSIASGVDNIISAFPDLNRWRVEMAIGIIVMLVAMNLRGVRESGKAFAVPTYLFIGSVGVTILVGLLRHLFGTLPDAESAGYTVLTPSMGQAAIVLLLLRGFASGCATLTGVEAVANGVPAFRQPKVRNAQRTLTTMGILSASFFAGMTALALFTHVHYAETKCDLIGWTACADEPQRSVIAQIAAAVYGSDHHIMFYAVQITTALILLLAANTAFNGFPLLSSVLARDGYAPKALRTRGDRLVFSNGVISLGVAASGLLILYQANLTKLIQLYIIGVFISFTLGQTGMVIHWTRELREKSVPRREGNISRAINTVGMVSTGSVLCIVTITKFVHGAWLVFAAMPILIWIMYQTRQYYRHVDNQIRVDGKTEFGSSGDHAIVLVGRLHKPVLKALDYAIAANHKSLEAVHVNMDEIGAERLKRAWKRQHILIPLRIIPSPYRDVSEPLIDYIRAHRESNGSEVITVYVPQYIYGHWWEGFLHNRRTQRVRNRLMLFPGVEVTLVPWLLDSSRYLYTRPDRPLPGQVRRGEPISPPRPGRSTKPRKNTPKVRKDGTPANTRSTDTPSTPPGKR
jgi:amino acid transporter